MTATLPPAQRPSTPVAGYGSPSQGENETVDMLFEIMDGKTDKETILRVLRKHGGAMDKAADALLEESGREAPNVYSETDARQAGLANTQVMNDTPTINVPKQQEIIDLTNDDDEPPPLMKDRMANMVKTMLKNSDRAPSDNWAMVRSDVPTGGASGDFNDSSLSQAIEASLNDMPADDFHVPPVGVLLRRDERPPTGRSPDTRRAYASLIFQALYTIPQVRDRVSRWRPASSTYDVDPGARGVTPPIHGPEADMFKLVEMFTYFDLSMMLHMDLGQMIESLQVPQLSSASQSPGEVSSRFLEHVMRLVNASVVPSPSYPNLFYLPVVHVPVRDLDDGPDDLLSALSHQQASAINPRSAYIEHAEVFAFQLRRDDSAAAAKRVRRPFRYPKHIYLDPFLRENAEKSTELRKLRKALEDEMANLGMRTRALTNFNNRDTLADLRASVYYYENVAQDGDDAERKAINKAMAEKLKSVIEKIEQEIRDINARIEQLKEEAAAVLDCPELRRHRYELRAVLVHDGLFGRMHLYSYTLFNNKWWKTRDYEVNEVSEDEVLTDPIGLHLGAGPYILLYSRALPEGAEADLRLHWPHLIEEDVEQNNQTFLGQLPADMAKLAYYPRKQSVETQSMDVGP